MQKDEGKSLYWKKGKNHHPGKQKKCRNWKTRLNTIALAASEQTDEGTRLSLVILPALLYSCVNGRGPNKLG